MFCTAAATRRVVVSVARIGGASFPLSVAGSLLVTHAGERRFWVKVSRRQHPKKIYAIHVRNHMSFASCTGTTRETCRPPCELHFHPSGVDVLDVYCVPPSEALGRPLSDKDLRRMKALLSGVITGPQTGVIDGALRNLHAGMRAFIDDRIKQHTFAQHRHTSDDWEQIARSITSEVLNDVYNLRCPICIEEFDDHKRRAFVLTCPGGLRTPLHIDCYDDLVASGEGGVNCPMCRQPLHGTHNKPPETLASIAKHTRCRLRTNN